MNGCDFGQLIKLMDKELGLDEQLGVLAHLDECEICREAVYLVRRDRGGPRACREDELWVRGAGSVDDEGPEVHYRRAVLRARDLDVTPKLGDDVARGHGRGVDLVVVSH